MAGPPRSWTWSWLISSFGSRHHHREGLSDDLKGVDAVDTTSLEAQVQRTKVRRRSFVPAKPRYSFARFLYLTSKKIIFTMPSMRVGGHATSGFRKQNSLRVWPGTRRFPIWILGRPRRRQVVLFRSGKTRKGTGLADQRGFGLPIPGGGPVAQQGCRLRGSGSPIA